MKKFSTKEEAELYLKAHQKEGNIKLQLFHLKNTKDWWIATKQEWRN